MLKDITLGQFFPGKSAVHRLDPRTKLIGLIVFIAALFTSDNFSGYFFCFFFIAIAIAISRISPKLIVRGLKPLIIIVLVTAFINMFATPGTPIFTVWVLTVTIEGARMAAFMAMRIILLICATSLLTYTTSPIALADALETLLAPLKKIKVPVHEFSMMMTIALRFIPTLIEETDKIMSAQKARGSDFESGSVIRRAKALTPVLIPLFISAFRRADELATAMECRLYKGGEGRTRLNSLKFSKIDIFGAIILAALIPIVILLGRFSL